MRVEKNYEGYSKLPQFRKVLAAKKAELKDLSSQSTVEIRWDLNELAIRDKIFEININGEKALIDLEELTHYTRAI